MEWPTLPDDVVDLIVSHSSHKIASISKDLRERYIRYCQRQLQLKYPSFLHLSRDPICDLYALEHLKLVPTKRSYPRDNMFELFLVVGTQQASFLFPCTFGCCMAWNRYIGMYYLVLHNAPAFFSVFDYVANDEYIVLVEYDTVVKLHMLNLNNNQWLSHTLHILNLNYIHMFWDTDSEFYLIAFEGVVGTVLTVNCVTGQSTYRAKTTVPADCLLSHANKYLVGYNNDPDLFIPIKTKIGWMKRFNINSMCYEPINMPPKVTKGFYQMFEIGDFIMFFIDKFRKIACLYNMEWLPDIDVPVMGLPPWNCWSVMDDAIIVWDIWVKHIDVLEYRVLRTRAASTEAPRAHIQAAP